MHKITKATNINCKYCAQNNKKIFLPSLHRHAHPSGPRFHSMRPRARALLQRRRQECFDSAGPVDVRIPPERFTLGHTRLLPHVNSEQVSKNPLKSKLPVASLALFRRARSRAAHPSARLPVKIDRCWCQLKLADRTHEIAQ